MTTALGVAGLAGVYLGAVAARGASSVSLVFGVVVASVGAILVLSTAHRTRQRRWELDELAAIGQSFAHLPFRVTGWRDYLLADRPTIGVMAAIPTPVCDLADAAHAIDPRIAVATIDEVTYRFHLPASAAADLGADSLARRLIARVIVPMQGVTQVNLGGEATR